jgi:hypothetical protein
MARFEHKYAALVLHDDKGVWAEFTPAERWVDGREQRYGVLETDDAVQIKRLRAALKTDPDLTEVKADQADADK